MASKLLVNVRLVGSNQTRTTQVDQIMKNVTNAFARMIVRDVVIQASKRYRDSIGRTLAKNVEKSLRAEADRMARLIARSMIRPENYNGPRGGMNLGTENGITQSETFRNKGWSQFYDASRSGIRWAARDPDYVRRKKDKSWWRKRGHLHRFLSTRTGKWYEQAFGPIRVLWIPSPKSDPGPVPKTTSSGIRPPKNEKVSVGRIEVIAFGNITPDALPGLAGFEPMTSAPTLWNGAGLAAMLGATHYNRKWAAKLMQKSTSKIRVGGGMQERSPRPGGWTKNRPQFRRRKRQYRELTPEHRPWIDPFVSFFLTRAMPNAVWRRLERQINNEARPQQKRTGSRDRSGLF